MSTVSKEELQHKIKELAEESGIQISSEVVKNAVGLIEFLIRSGLDYPLKVEPLIENHGEGSLKIKLKNNQTRAELVLTKNSKESVLKIFQENTNCVFEMKGSVQIS